jgi:hypothetical protein
MKPVRSDDIADSDQSGHYLDPGRKDLVMRVSGNFAWMITQFILSADS